MGGKGTRCVVCPKSDWSPRLNRQVDGTFLSQHDPVGLASSVLRLQREVVEDEAEPGGRSVDLQTTHAVDVGRVDVRVARRHQVSGPDAARTHRAHVRRLAPCSVAVVIATRDRPVSTSGTTAGGPGRSKNRGLSPTCRQCSVSKAGGRGRPRRHLPRGDTSTINSLNSLDKSGPNCLGYLSSKCRPSASAAWGAS